MSNNYFAPQVYVPAMTIERFAQAIGVSKDVVNGWVRRGYIPTIKYGKRRLVNIAAIIRSIQEDN